MAANQNIYGDIGQEWSDRFPHLGKWIVPERLDCGACHLNGSPVLARELPFRYRGLLQGRL